VLVIFGFPLSLPYLALPVLLLVNGLFITGCTLIAAGLTPFFPDLRMVLDNVVRLWFFLSGIFYPVADLSPQLRSLFRLNPMATVIDSYRAVMMRGQWPSFTALAVVAVIALFLNVVGFLIIARFDYVYPRLSH
jgi:lipopolysaccharide transport system permease protein